MNLQLTPKAQNIILERGGDATIGLKAQVCYT